MESYWIFLVAILVQSAVAGWQDDIQPKRSITLGEEQVLRFHGNRSHSDHFKLLDMNGNSILIGARNIVYNLSLNEMTENREQRVEWYPSEHHRDICLIKGKSESDCQNYIRVLARVNDGEMLICGTNAYNPLCRRYVTNGTGLQVSREYSGKGMSPYDPNHNSTAVFTDGELYAGTVSDFSGLDPLIYKDPLRTEQYDFKHLNAPSFVSSVAEGDYVYFFFRETAIEYINCGKTVYSRVGRVCKKDKGGPHRWSNRWTSFLKSRLNCSLPGDFPFYFDEIQSTSDVVEGTYGHRTERLIYGVFTTPENSISGSAICAFRIQDVMDSFDAAFKEQESMNSNWLPVGANDVPEPRPGQCVNDSRTLPEVTLNFIKSHSLMDESVPAFYGLPLVTHTSLTYKFTKLAVDPQVRTADGKTFDILIIGTDKGKVIRAINTAAYDSVSRVTPVIIEEIQVFDSQAAITNLKVVRTGQHHGPRLIVVSNDEIQTIPLRRCYTSSVSTCSECVALQDPYCAWNPSTSRCVTVGSVSTSSQSSLVQDIIAGYSDQCPDNGIFKDKDQDRVQLASKSQPIGPKVGASQSVQGDYSAETFTIAVVVACFASLVVGFLGGLMFSRRCKLEDYSGGFNGAPYLEQRRLSRLNETITAHQNIEPSKMNNFIDNQTVKLANEKNSNAVTTLDMKPVQKVKKTYV